MEFLKRRLADTNIDFVGRRRYAAVLSILMVLGSWLAVFAIGPNWGIDFTGGTEIQIEFHEDVQIGEVRTALAKLGLSEDAVQQVGAAEENEFLVRIQDASFGSEELRADVRGALEATFGTEWIQEESFDAEVGARIAINYAGDFVEPKLVDDALSGIQGVNVQQGRDRNQVIIRVPGLAQQIQRELAEVLEAEFEVLKIDAVGPKVGNELVRTGVISVLATLGLVLVYVAFRFELAFAPGAILALFHDVSITLGIFVLLQKELSLPMIGAMLTIIGYSLNDTIVIYDRIRENMERYRRTELPELINVSINETLARTVATSTTTLLAISAFLFLGGPVIQNFALAMMFGIIFGTYSTVFVASPTVLLMQDISPKLSGLIASGDTGGDDDQTDEGPLSESEKRRRERDASRQKALES